MSKKAEAVVEEGHDPVAAPLTRAEIRSALIGSTPLAKSVLIHVWGIDMELRQPTLKAIMDTRDIESSSERAVEMIIKYAYVPGTDELIFEDSDAELILRWPFGEDMLKVQETITELTGLDIESAKEDLKDNPLVE